MHFSMNDDYPSRSLDKIVIRVPDGLRDRIQRVAAMNGRSVNAELILLLERQYPPETKLDGYIQDIAALIEKMPTDNQDNVWRSVFEKLEAVRRQSDR